MNLRSTPATDARPLIGVIVPPADGAIPPELPALFGAAATFRGFGLALPQMNEQGFDAVIDRVAEASRSLATAGVDAIALMGTSLSFYRGAAFNDLLRATIHDATGLPAVTMSDAIVGALRGCGARRLAVATAYTDDVNRRLVAFLAESGFQVDALDALQLLTVAEVHAVDDAQLVSLGQRVFAAAPRSDALLISCGGLRTLGPGRALEATLGVPVVSSAVAGARAAAQLVGL